VIQPISEQAVLQSAMLFDLQGFHDFVLPLAGFVRPTESYGQKYHDFFDAEVASQAGIFKMETAPHPHKTIQAALVPTQMYF